MSVEICIHVYLYISMERHRKGNKFTQTPWAAANIQSNQLTRTSTAPSRPKPNLNPNTHHHHVTHAHTAQRQRAGDHRGGACGATALCGPRHAVRPLLLVSVYVGVWGLSQRSRRHNDYSDDDDGPLLMPRTDRPTKTNEQDGRPKLPAGLLDERRLEGQALGGGESHHMYTCKRVYAWADMIYDALLFFPCPC
jgi:hypothetical protein